MDTSQLAPTVAEITEAAALIAPHAERTPVVAWAGRAVEARLAAGTELTLKLELFQHGGNFKTRGALVTMLGLSAEQQARGVTAVSAGNHAIAVAYAASRLGLSAKVVMQATANPFRIAMARSFGAEVLIGGDGPSSFALAEAIAQREGRLLIHPFEGKNVALGTGTVGLELHEQLRDIDAVIIAVGGGGLAGGVSNLLRALRPSCEIFGVEPEGAASISRSLAVGRPVHLEEINTVADTLAPPMALPYTFSLCQAGLADVVTVSDDAMAEAQAFLFEHRKLAVEPAGAAALAGLFGPLRERLAGKRVVVIICGSNIDIESYAALVRRGIASRVA